MTRSQKLLAQALKDVQSVPEADQKLYGGLCHRLPSLVRRNGLCQALAFLDAKRSDGRIDAHELLLRHLAAHLNIDRTDRAALFTTVSEAPLAVYMHQTRTVLEALSYYKRFAVSILHVQPTDENDAEAS